jgi:hypothetical protein
VEEKAKSLRTVYRQQEKFAVEQAKQELKDEYETNLQATRQHAEATRVEYTRITEANEEQARQIKQLKQ